MDLQFYVTFTSFLTFLYWSVIQFSMLIFLLSSYRSQISIFLNFLFYWISNFLISSVFWRLLHPTPSMPYSLLLAICISSTDVRFRLLLNFDINFSPIILVFYLGTFSSSFFTFPSVSSILYFFPFLWFSVYPFFFFFRSPMALAKRLINRGMSNVL